MVARHGVKAKGDDSPIDWRFARAQRHSDQMAPFSIMDEMADESRGDQAGEQ
jgi:hypothetical protein